MRASFAADTLRCPACGADRALRLDCEAASALEVREGTLRCQSCAAEMVVHRGVAELLRDPPQHVVTEAAGLGRFADYMRADGWTPDRVRALPGTEGGYWRWQEISMIQLLQTIDFLPGQSLLDLGANTCWASNRFAQRGLEVIALDISLWEMQGLWTADYFIEAGDSYFERILASMNEIPIASGSLDYVFACEVLHHNDPDGLRRTFQEAWRVLKPGGRMLVINETLKSLDDRGGVHAEEVAQFEGYEHAHWAWQYRWAATRAGFVTRLLPPQYHPFWSRPLSETPTAQTPRQRVQRALRRHRIGRQIYLSYLNHKRGHIQFSMVATKPTFRRSRA